MEKHFVDYNQALALKELGFNEICFATFDSDKWFDIQDFGQNYDTFPSHIIAAPLKSQVFEWFRDKQNLRSNIMDFIDDVTGIEWDYEIDFIGVDVDENGNYKPLVDYSIDDETRKFKTYKEAESACIDKLIEIVKNK